MVLPSDKNLGPMVVNREDYVKAMIDQHLLCKKTHERISKEQAVEYLSETSTAFLDRVAKAENRIDNNDLKFTSRCSNQDTRIPVMHELGKCTRENLIFHHL